MPIKERAPRDVGAGGARPDALDTTITEIAEALSRLAWLYEYERAEALYWGRA